MVSVSIQFSILGSLIFMTDFSFGINTMSVHVAQKMMALIGPIVTQVTSKRTFLRMNSHVTIKMRIERKRFITMGTVEDVRVGSYQLSL